MLKKLAHDSRVNVTFITDIHLADRAPGRRRDNYRQAILDKLKFASDVTNKVNGVCICGGDVYHIKNANRNSHELVAASVNVFGSFPTGGVYGIVGNHDFSEDNIETLGKQPLKVLMEADVYRSVTEPVVFTPGDGSVKVLVVGFDYRNTEETIKAVTEFKTDLEADYKIAVIHQVGRPGNDGDFFGEKTIGYNSVSGLGFDVVLWGHDHSYVEPKTVDGTLHLHFGSLSRASLNTDEVDRDIVIPIISFSSEGMVLKQKIVPVTPLEACFNTADQGVRKIAKSEDIKNFLADMEEQVSEVESDDPLEILNTICKEKEVVDLIKDYCEI